MNKTQLLELAESLNIDKKDYYILSGGSLLLAGLRESTNDLDICVTQKGFEEIKERFNVSIKNESKKQYIITEDIECFVVEQIDNSKVEIRDGYQCESLKSVYEFKKRVNRPKDQQDIKNLEDYFNNN